MKTPSISQLTTLLLLGLCGTVSAQPALIDPWPAAPKFDLNDNYTPSEREVLDRLIPYYDFTEKDFSFLPLERLWRVPGLRDKALELFETPPAIKGRIALAPGNSNVAGEVYLALGLVRVGGPTNQQPLVFYRKENTINCLRSPQFSPDGNSAVIRLGLPQDDQFIGFDLFLWNFHEARFRYLPMRGADDAKNPYVAVDSSHYYDLIHWSPGSRYLSYIRGGKTGGLGYSDDAEPLYLCVLDTVTRRERLIMKDVDWQWSWTYRGQILCSPGDGWSLDQHLKRASIYVTNVQSGTPRKLFDGGYYAQESPLGRYIAFCDWPGEILNAPKASSALKRSHKRGLFLWDKTKKTRTFVGAMSLFPGENPLIQWSPDGRTLYVAERITSRVTGGNIRYIISRLTLTKRKLEKFAELTAAPQGQPYLSSRGISPDGTRLYYQWTTQVDGPKDHTNERYALLALDTKNAEETKIASLTNIVNEHPDWDWHDDSGINPAFAAARKFEKTLPVIKAPRSYQP